MSNEIESVVAPQPLSRVDKLSRQKYVDLEEVISLSREAFSSLQGSRNRLLKRLSQKFPDLALCGKKIFFSRYKQDKAEQKVLGELEKLETDVMDSRQKRLRTLAHIEAYCHSVKKAGSNRGSRLFRMFDWARSADKTVMMSRICDRILHALKKHTYEGQWACQEGVNVPHGKGQLTEASGECYKGDFQRGKRHGEGLLMFENGDYRAGNFSDDTFQGNGKGKITSISSDCYEGELKNDKPDGTGRLIDAAGNCYEGEFMDGKLRGKGRLLYADGKCYEGEFRDGQPHGKGRLIYADGDIYEGEFKNGKPDGEGQLTYTTGRCLKGKFADGILTGQLYWIPDGRPQGTGRFIGASVEVLAGKVKSGVCQEQVKLTCPNGDYYEGILDQSGKPHKAGKGRLTLKDGSIYEGAFWNGQPHGSGKKTFRNGLCLTGNFKDGKPDGKVEMSFLSGIVHRAGFADGDSHKSGKGRFTYISGAVYEGNLDKGKRHGEGVLRYPNGDIYQGNFENDQPDGTGIYTCANGTVYQGGFKNGKRDGEGSLTCPNGDYYQGDFYDDGIQGVGEGQRTLPGGDYYKGGFKNGKPYGAGAGRQTYTDGTVYEGKLINGRPHGKGKVTFENGIIYEGSFREGYFDGEGVFTGENSTASANREGDFLGAVLSSEDMEKELENYKSVITFFPMKSPAWIAEIDENSNFLRKVIFCKEDLENMMKQWRQEHEWLINPGTRNRLVFKWDEENPIKPALTQLKSLRVDQETRSIIEELKMGKFRVHKDRLRKAVPKREIRFDLL